MVDSGCLHDTDAICRDFLKERLDSFRIICVSPGAIATRLNRETCIKLLLGDVNSNNFVYICHAN